MTYEIIISCYIIPTKLKLWCSVAYSATSSPFYPQSLYRCFTFIILRLDLNSVLPTLLEASPAWFFFPQKFYADLIQISRGLNALTSCDDLILLVKNYCALKIVKTYIYNLHTYLILFSPY